MLVTNSEFNCNGAGVNETKSVILRAFNYGLDSLIEAGKRHANSPLFSIELAMCVAQCMGEKYLMAVQKAGMA